MEWLKELFVEHSALQAVVVVSLISTIGIGLGKIRFFGISLGTAFIFFVGILAGHFGLSLDPAMLTYAESFGLVIFVYALGLQVGPGFFSSMRADGLRLVSPPSPSCARNGPGHGDELRLRSLDARHVGHSVRRDDQHPGAGRRAADTATNGHRRQRSGVELRRWPTRWAS